MIWRGIVGRCFSAADFRAYVRTVSFTRWRPHFVAVHNTSEPDLATYEGHWNRAHPVTDEDWMRNLEGYYRDQQHWSAGPHLFITPRAICVFTPLNLPGVHSPSWNTISWGVEIVGEYERDKFEGPVRDNAIHAVAILHAALGLNPYGLMFHKEDPRTTHKTCPGRNIVKKDFIDAVVDAMHELHPGEHGAVA